MVKIELMLEKVICFYFILFYERYKLIQLRHLRDNNLYAIAFFF